MTGERTVCREWAESSMCPACAGRTWKDYRIAGKILALPAPYRILRCSGCGTSKLYPALTAEQNRALYNGEYFGVALEGAGKTFFKDVPGILDYAATPRYVEASEARLSKFLRVISELKAMYPEGKTVLDVGSATGDFIDAARKKDLTAVGLEPSMEAVKEAKKRGINIIHGDIWAIDKKFDFIHLNHVFEHYSDPGRELHRLKELASDKALVYIGLPYQFNGVERLKRAAGGRAFKCSVSSFHHPYMYTPSSIRLFLARAGYRIVKMRLFDPCSYETAGPGSSLKKYLWRILAGFDIGNNMEIFARL